jgi:16S rRNA (adenine1518-N6/adenine1519-N6)-dimethyltransferase
MAAPPGSKTYGALSVNVQSVASVELIKHVPPEAFRPAPAVDSAVVRVVPRADPVIGVELEAEFRQFVQAAFSFRRKQLGRVLRNVLRLSAEQSVEIVEQCGLTTDLRPEVLSPADFARLVHAARR